LVIARQTIRGDEKSFSPLDEEVDCSICVESKVCADVARHLEDCCDNRKSLRVNRRQLKMTIGKEDECVDMVEKLPNSTKIRSN
jgi:queuine/archaeosine tRNA-ribosyltransferase